MKSSNSSSRVQDPRDGTLDWGAGIWDGPNKGSLPLSCTLTPCAKRFGKFNFINVNETNMDILGTKPRPDTCVSLGPYFLISLGKEEEVKSLLKDFMAKTQKESKCLYYSFTLNGNEMHCREGYTDADGLLEHLDNVEELLSKLQTLASLTRCEVHGPSSELDKLKGPLKEMNPSFFAIECGFRN